MSTGGGGKGGKSKGVKVDMALLLVQEGLAVTVRHRGDEPRCVLVIIDGLMTVRRVCG